MRAPDLYAPQTAKDVLAWELLRELRALQRKHFFDIRKPYRIRQIEEWLRAVPPPGWAFRCKHCLLGTGCADRVCVACWAY